MKLLFAAPLGALALSAASPPIQQPEHTSLKAMRPDAGETEAASRKTFQARVNEAIVQLCPDHALSSAQRSCEKMARIAVQAQLAEEPLQK